MEEERFYIEIRCTKSELDLIFFYFKKNQIKATYLDTLFKPEDYVDGNMERGHLNKSGWDKLFNKKEPLNKDED